MHVRCSILAVFCVSLLIPSGFIMGATMESDEQIIRSIYDSYAAAIAAKDIDTVMSFYTSDVVAFDAFPPRQYTGAAAYRKDYEEFFAAFPGPAKSQVADLHIDIEGTFASVYGIDHWTVTASDGQSSEFTFRFTDIFKKINGKWLIFHEHLSFPVDAVSGKADFLSKP